MTEAQIAVMLAERDGDPVIDDGTSIRFHDYSIPHSKNVSPGGVKADTGKPRFDLIPVEALQAMANRLTLGAEKYGERNWEGGIAYSRAYAALLRHVLAWWGGQDIDPDPAAKGSSHLEAVAINAAFLVTYEKRFGPGNRFDDRPKNSTPL